MDDAADRLAARAPIAPSSQSARTRRAHATRRPCVKMEGVANAERPASMRIGRVAEELKMRRRRLDVYQLSPDWPGKDPA